MTQMETESWAPHETASAAEHTHQLPVIQPPRTNRWLSAPYALLYFFLGVALVWIFSGYYTVGEGEVALVERLGQFITLPDGKPRLLEAGLHYHLPWPIDEIYIVPLSREHLLTVTDFNTSPISYEAQRKQLMRAGESREVVDALYNPYLITGDQNVLHAQMAVQYHISKPLEYLMAVYQPPNLPAGEGRRKVLSILTDHEMILKLARSTVQEALYSGKQKLAAEIFDIAHPKQGLQAPIDQLGLGLQVQSVSLKSITWPAAVNTAFSAVLNARQQEESQIQNAKKTANSLTTLAQGKAQAVEQQAQAEARQHINQAQGETQEFTQIYTQYRVDPRGVTLKLFSDTLGGVMQKVDRVFFVQPGQRILLSLPPPKKKVVVPTSP